MIKIYVGYQKYYYLEKNRDENQGEDLGQRRDHYDDNGSLK